MTTWRWHAVLALPLLCAGSCDAGSTCAFNSDCAAGSFCRDGACATDCSSTMPCPSGQACTSFGQCVAADAGAEDAGARDAGPPDAGRNDAGVDAGRADGGCVDETTRACIVAECASTGTQTCAGGAFGECVLPDETCNDTDDDCDGTTDEGFRTVYRTVSYASDLGGVCPTAVSVECRAAVHAYCQALECEASGVGPVESSGDSAWIGCVRGVEVVRTYADSLALQGVGCTSSNPLSTSCRAAVHRYCLGEGYSTGFGPTLSIGETAHFTCVPHATVLTVPLSELAAHHAECDNHSEVLASIQCASAINRRCQESGHLMGFGPLEHSGGAAAIACLDP